MFVVSGADQGLLRRCIVALLPSARRHRQAAPPVSVLTLLLALMGVLWSGVAQAADKRLSIVVSMQPLARVVDSSVPADVTTVSTLLEKGVTPHDATLRPSQVKALLDADLVYWWGPQVEPYLAPWIRKRTALSRDLSALPGIETLPLRRSGRDPHDHGAEHVVEDETGHPHAGHQHAPDAFDIHLWWSHGNMRLVAEAIRQDVALQRPDLLPALESLARANRARWDALASEAGALGAKRPRYVVFHDGWQYLEHDIGVAPEAHLISHDELGSGVKRLLGLKQRLAEGAPACALVEPGMNTDLVDKLLPGVRKRSLDPMGWDAPGQDVFALFSHAYGALADCAGR